MASSVTRAALASEAAHVAQVRSPPMAVSGMARVLLAGLAWLHPQRAGAHRFPIAPRTVPRAPSALACASDRLAALSLPSEPDPKLEPDGVVRAICRGLQHNDTPNPNAGLSRLFNFATYECRAALTARKGKETEARFVRYADSPALIALLGCDSFELTQPPTVIPGTQTRGALATQIVLVREARGFRYKSGHERPAEQVGTLHEENYLFTLEQQRRPPLAGCWMVKELLPMRHHMMFAGDSGGTVY